jgi:hypothetical protein
MGGADFAIRLYGDTIQALTRSFYETYRSDWTGFWKVNRFRASRARQIKKGTVALRV